MVCQHIVCMLVTVSLKAVRMSQRVIFFLPEEPGSDYKPCDASAMHEIIIDGDKDKHDEGKDDGLSSDGGSKDFDFYH